MFTDQSQQSKYCRVIKVHTLAQFSFDFTVSFLLYGDDFKTDMFGHKGKEAMSKL